MVRVLRQPRGKHETGGSSTTDDKVISLTQLGGIRYDRSRLKMLRVQVAQVALASPTEGGGDKEKGIEEDGLCSLAHGRNQ